MRIIISSKKPVEGRIHDISIRGAAVECEPTWRVNINDDVFIAIFSGERCIRDIRCSLVYDIATLTHNRTFRGKYTRQIGLLFKGLKKKDKAILSQYMASVSTHDQAL